MSTWRKVGCCLAMVAGVALGAFGYDDELVTIDDDSVVVKANKDGSSVYIFTNTAASATITTRTQVMFMECLVVGGGGGGGWTIGGGGGGGGVRHVQGIGLFLPAGETMTATVGAGGLSPLKSGSTTAGGQWLAGLSGANSALTVGGTTYTGHGGGGGGGWDSGTKTGFAGGSSGGACQQNKAKAVAKDANEMGNKGGDASGNNPGGGGGATEPGDPGSSDRGGKGGEGYTCQITGEPVVYGSGGGSGGGTGSFKPANVGGTNAGDGSADYPTPGGRGTPCTGGGGGGGAYSATQNRGSIGGDGGSGIVVMVLVPPTEELRSLKVDPVPDQDFLGGNVCPLPVVRDLESGTVLVRDEHYTLSWSHNDRLGRGTVKVQGLGVYRYSVDETSFGIKDGCLDYDFACEPITVGSRTVYVISNVTAETVVRVKAAMVLEEALVVAGGGAGGYTIGGGGGGGGVIHLEPSAALKAGDRLVLSVGRGGSPTENAVLNAGFAQNNWPWGGSGGDSTLVISAAGICALAHGGGGGGGWDSRHKAGISGGSSGGTCQKTTTRTEPTKSEGEMGNAGGAASSESPGGGGGATQAGFDGTEKGAAGAGGEGYACWITGKEVVYGSGGGGGRGNSCTAVGAGGTNAGAGGGGNAKNGFGGGGGGGTYGSGSGVGGAGGCGTVILSFSSAVSVPNRFVVEDIPNQAVTGSAVEPAPVVRDKATGDVLARDADYEVAYEGNVGPGTGYAVVTGIGGYANNRWRVPFNILPSAAVNAKWTYADGMLTEVVPLESPRTPWVFTLTEAGLLTRATRGGSTELDLGSAALPTDAPEIVSVAAASFAESLNLVSVRMPSNVTTIAANAFKSTTALNTIRFDGWYDLATENKAIGNWADRKCRFVVPGDNKSWLGFIATTQFVEPWDSLSDAAKGEYLALYGEEAHLIPVGLTVSGATAVKRTWIVKTDAVIASSIVEVVEPEAEFGSVTRDPAPGADGSYAPGTAVTVTFVPAAGVTFNRWNGDVREEDARNLSVVVIAEGMKTLSPDFSANFLVYRNGKLTDNVEIVNATGETNAIVVTGAERYNNGVLDLSKPIYGGGKITGVADSAFASYKCTAGRLLLPETIERLEYRAFDCCNTLTNITPLLPTSVRYLGNSALAMMPNLRGNLTIGFGTEEDGSPIVVTFGRGNVDETNSARTFQQAQLGPLVRIGPGVVSVPTGLLQFSQRATNIWISAGSTKVEPLAFRRMHGCDIVFEGDMPAVSQNSFELELDTYKFKQRYYSPWTGGKTLKNWAAYLRDETKVKPWSKLTAEEKQKYFTAFPNADRRDHPYGLTLTVSNGSALPADQWVFAPARMGGMLIVR